MAIAALACGGDDKKADDAMQTPGSLQCTASEQVACTCADGRMLKTCMVGHRAAVCPCFGNADPSVTAVKGTGGAMGMAGSGGADGAAGAPMMTGSGGSPAMTGSGGGGEPTGSDEVQALRQVCVDAINTYRATVDVTPKLEPLMRGTPDDETCSDMGAKIDGDSGQAHKSAGMCMGYGGQDACPGWPVGGRGRYATLEAALLDCLQQMWDEGEPPNGRDACLKDQAAGGCFQTYGHWLNMSSPDYTGVMCGFYLMSDGMSWWMNQDFKSKPWMF